MKTIYDLKIDDVAYVIDSHGWITEVEVHSINRELIEFNGHYERRAEIKNVCDSGTKIKLSRSDFGFIADRKKAILLSKKIKEELIIECRKELIEEVSRISLKIEQLHNSIIEIDNELISSHEKSFGKEKGKA